MINRGRTSTGFTLIELAVTMAIFSVLVSVVLSNYNKFSSGAEFSSAAEDIVLNLREAQVYGVGSKSAGTDAGGTVITCDDNPPTGSPSQFKCAYGVAFDAGTPGSYTLFVDKDSNGLLASGEEVRTISFNNKAKISSVNCGTGACGDNGKVTTTFKRPFPDAHILSGTQSYNDARITVTPIDGSKTIEINISASGLISMKKL